MEKDKLTLYSRNLLTAREGQTVRCVLPDEVYRELRELHEKTGIAISQLTRYMVEFALPHVEVKD